MTAKRSPLTTRRSWLALGLRTVGVGAAAVTLTTVTGCAHASRTVTPAQSAALTTDVTRLQDAATRGTAADISRAADALRAEVAKQRTTPSLSPERAAAILDQLARVLADTAGSADTAAAAVATTAASAPAVASPAPTGHQVKGAGKGKGKGGSDGAGGDGGD